MAYTFEEREQIKEIVKNMVRETYVKRGYSEIDCLAFMDGLYGKIYAAHMEECTSDSCDMKEKIDLILETTKEVYADRNELTVDEILRLAEEKL